jgi:hypothetical protein
MPSEHNMHRKKRFITNDTGQGLLVNVMGHHREILICMALNMVPDTVMVMGAMGTMGATAAVDETTEEEPYLS